MGHTDKKDSCTTEIPPVLVVIFIYTKPWNKKTGQMSQIDLQMLFLTMNASYFSIMVTGNSLKKVIWT